MSPCKLNNHRGLQHSNISLLFIISVLQFQPTPFLQCSFFEIRCPWYFRQSCLLTLHTGITHISGEISSVRMLHLSPFNETFNSDKWLPWSRRSRGVLGSKMLSSPSASKPPPGTSLVCVGSITRALASRACYIASSWESFWCLIGNSATQGYLSLEANSSA